MYSPRRLARTNFPIACALIACTLLPATAADNARSDFSGAYTLTGAKGSFKMNKASRWALQVVQTDGDITITKTVDGKPTINRCTLDGSASPYITEGGAKGSCTARFKGRALVIETSVTTHPQPAGPEVRIHTREQWTASSDSKLLTIRSDVDFPDTPLAGFQPVEPWSEIYTRDKP